MLKSLLPKFRSDLSVRLGDIAEKKTGNQEAETDSRSKRSMSCYSMRTLFLLISMVEVTTPYFRDVVMVPIYC